MENSGNLPDAGTEPHSSNPKPETNLSSSHLPYLSPQQISDLEEQWRVSRTKITLFQQPKKTIFLFSAASYNVLKNTFLYLISHPVLLKLLLPLLGLWYVLEHIPGFYTEPINEIEFWIQYVTWWIGLGILSSIGLGSGLQTGVLFLFPHIMRVCITAQTCKSVNFHSFGAIWFHSAESHNLFKCYEEPSPNQPPPSYFSMSLCSSWLLTARRCLVACFDSKLPPINWYNISSDTSQCSKLGTAIGEIPPYWMTRAARQAAIDAGEKVEVPEELETNSQYGLVNRLKGLFYLHFISDNFQAKLISFLRSHGFLGVLLMASWPNFAFDLCGICCGHFMMPFWTFFGATFLGGYVTSTILTVFREGLCAEYLSNSHSCGVI